MNFAKILRVGHAAALLIVLAAGLAFGAEEKKTDANAETGDRVQTPFGPARKQAPDAKPAPRPTAAKPLVEVGLEGDTYTFTRKTPFGAQSWKRAKADLSADEKKLIADQEAWEKQQGEPAEPAEPQPAPPAKPQS